MTQTNAAVLAPSKAAAASALGVSMAHFNNYFSETGNEECITALERHPAGTVLVKPLDPGGTLRGSKDWQPS